MRDRSGPRGGRLLTAALSAVLLALIMAAHALIPSPADTVGPIAYGGAIGEPVDAEVFTVEVERIEIARSAYDGAGDAGEFGIEGEPIEANGVWLVAWLTVEARRESLPNVSAELDAGGGYTYSSSMWFMNTLESNGAPFEPARPEYGAIVFEVAENRLTDPTLQVSLNTSLDARLSARADIDLGLRGTELAALVEDPEDEVAIPPTEMR
ncbi:hypothetical protein [Nocardiopsis trehalosi]|uniref:hypothetical protein n=1 Tax=Nocardiopsis trehalosi TaxID=109329 RepID=UPI00082FFAA7|nr:hypothetical protein [Nocardiopsis trehalosi]